MRSTFVTHLRTRGRLVALSLGLGAGIHACESFPRERSLEALTELAGRASQSEASATAWEPSRGVLLDLLDGRGFLFLGRDEKTGQNDVRRGFVRVSPDGSPLSLTRIQNLTNTSLADERGLSVRGSRAVFATVAFDEVESLTLLDASGASKPANLLGRLRRFARSAFSPGGEAERTDFVFSPAPTELGVTLATDVLELTAGDAKHHVALSGAALHRVTAEKADGTPTEMTVSVLDRAPEPQSFGDAVRRAATSLLGTPRGGAVERASLALRDRGRRFGHTFDASDERTLAGEPQLAQAEPGAASHPWPPSAVPSLWQAPREGEGHWVPVLSSATPAEKSPPYLYRTFVRPDRERPFADVVLVALDMRRLELGYQAGYATPAPSAGVPGSGRLPEDAAKHVIATFNGVSTSAPGEAGAVVAHRVLVPPATSAPTVRIDRSGRVGVGAWPEQSAPSETEGPRGLPDDLVSLRQGLGPLALHGTAQPARSPNTLRSLPNAAISERSALCVTRAGHLLYAWSAAIDVAGLTEAMRLADCASAFDLSEHDGDASFVNVDARTAHTERLDTRMSTVDGHFGGSSPSDFFYVTLRETTPRAGSLAWRADAGTQPPPTGLPGIFSAQQGFGALSVELTRFEAGRFDWRVGAGTREATDTVLDHELSGSEPNLVLAAIGVGHTTEATRYGLAVRGNVAVPLQRSLATLVLPRGGAPYVAPSGVPLSLPEGAEAVQLPLLAQNGELTARARELGAQRKRGALCIDPAGNLLVARLEHDSPAPAARVLLELGCSLVLEMDRGSHSAPSVERRETEQAPSAAAGLSTVLYALARDPSPRAYALQSEAMAP